MININKTALFTAAVLMCAGTQAYAASPLDVGIGVVSGMVLGSILSHPAPAYYAAPEVQYRTPPVAYEAPSPVYYAPPRAEYYYGQPVVIYREDRRCWHRCWHEEGDRD